LGGLVAVLVFTYQQRATQCVVLAQATSDLKAKLTLLEMARAWLASAEQAIKNSETVLVYEPPSTAAD
jgi:hypothetical protein